MMDDYEKVFKSICRVCLSRSSAEKLVSLYDNSNEDGLSSFGKAVTVFTKVVLQNNDTLPIMICSKCVYLLKNAIYFKLKCESSDQKLKQLINTEKNIEAPDENSMEKICDYVIFNYYFPAITSTKLLSEGIKSTKPLKASETVETNCETVENSSEDQLVFENKTYNENFDEDTFFNDDHCDDTNKVGDSDELDSIWDTLRDIINSDKFKKSDNGRNLPSQKKRLNQTKCETVRNLLCEICNKTLSNSVTYDHHMQRHNICRYICEKCGKGFPVLADMYSHQVVRHDIGPYLKCDHCPFKAPRKYCLIEHLRIHTGERPFTCDKCGLTFRRRALWRNHLVHHMEKKHQCMYCTKKFFTRSHMLVHYNNVHQRIYKYMCNICSIMYSKTSTVRQHMTVKHGIPREKQGKILRVTVAGGGFPDKFKWKLNL